MGSAELWAKRSTCSRAQVGVVAATPDYRPLVSGYNGAPAGMAHCDHTCNCRAGINRQPDHFSYCASVSPCRISVHAEANAVAFAAREGLSLKGGQLFSTVSPCHNCCLLLINVGVVRVVYLRDHRETDGLDLLAAASIEVVKYAHDR